MFFTVFGETCAGSFPLEALSPILSLRHAPVGWVLSNRFLVVHLEVGYA